MINKHCDQRLTWVGFFLNTRLQRYFTKWRCDICKREFNQKTTRKYKEQRYISSSTDGY